MTSLPASTRCKLGFVTHRDIRVGCHACLMIGRQRSTVGQGPKVLAYGEGR